LDPRKRKKKNLRREPKAATAIVLEGIPAIRVNAANSHAAAVSSAESAAASLLTRINDATNRTETITKAIGLSLITKTLTSKIR